MNVPYICSKILPLIDGLKPIEVYQLYDRCDELVSQIYVTCLYMNTIIKYEIVNLNFAELG